MRIALCRSRTGEHGATARGQHLGRSGLLTGDPTHGECVSHADMARTASAETRRVHNRLRFVGPVVQGSMLDFGCFDGEDAPSPHGAVFTSLAVRPRRVPLLDEVPVVQHPNQPVRRSTATGIVIWVGLAVCHRRWFDGPLSASSHDYSRGLPPRNPVSLTLRSWQTDRTVSTDVLRSAGVFNSRPEIAVTVQQRRAPQLLGSAYTMYTHEHVYPRLRRNQGETGEAEA
jgi:hypothetical protein